MSCHSEAHFHRARNLMSPGQQQFLTGKERRFGMTKWLNYGL